MLLFLTGCSSIIFMEEITQLKKLIEFEPKTNMARRHNQNPKTANRQKYQGKSTEVFIPPRNGSKPGQHLQAGTVRGPIQLSTL